VFTVRTAACEFLEVDIMDAQCYKSTKYSALIRVRVYYSQFHELLPVVIRR
jgi:hypothetical protein